MGANSSIEWTHHTFNPWSGCTKVSAECEHCYAETDYSVKMRGVKWGPNGNRIVKAESGWKEPLTWNRKAEAAGERHRVFCASLADVFEDWEGPMQHASGAKMWFMHEPNGHPCQWGAGYVLDDPRTGRALTLDDVRDRLFKLIAATPSLDWLLLTKRPENVARCLDRLATMNDHYDCVELSKAWLSRVWLGASVGVRKTLNRIDELRKIPAALRFLSIEPLLEDLGQLDLTGIHWVIVGGESKWGARPMHPDWVRSIRDQCLAAGVPFFFKQWGEWKPISEMPNGESGALYEPAPERDPEATRECRVATRPIRFDGGEDFWAVDGHIAYQTFRVGKKAAGRLLDGREWSELPKVAV